MVNTNTTTALPTSCVPSPIEDIPTNGKPEPIDETIEQDTSPQPETPGGPGGPTGSLPLTSSSLPTPGSLPGGPPLPTSSLKDPAETSVVPLNVDTSALQPITLPVMNSLVSTNKVVVDASIDTDMVPEFPSDATQNPLDFIHKAEPG